MNNNFYVYALLDPRVCKYYNIEKYDFTINYQPFYIGKGKGSRINTHLNVHTKVIDNENKNEKIKNILNDNREPICLKLFTDLEETTAYEIEIELIKFFGRVVNNTGPLFNISTGGKGSKGIIPTEEARLNLSQKRMGKYMGEDSPISKKCYQYDLKGNFIKEWITLTDAAKDTKTSIGNLCLCLRGRTKTCKKYQWFYDFEGIKVDEVISYESDYRNKRKLRLKLLDENKILIGEFNSSLELGKYLNVSGGSIRAYLYKKRKTKNDNLLFKNKYIIENF